MERVAVWSAFLLLVPGAGGVAGQVAPRAQRAPAPAPTPTTIRVPGEVASLQRAIELSSPGGLILVKGEHAPVTIDRPLAIVGDPEAEINMAFQDHGVRLEGPGHGCVTLAGLEIYSEYEYSRQTGITGGGFDELYVQDVDVTVAQALSGLGYGGSAVEIDVPLAIFSDVYARSTQPDVDECEGSLPDEVHAAIEAPDSTVIVVDSTLVGGDGGWLCCFGTAPWYCTCPTSLVGLGGIGGDALVAREAYVASSTLIGGQGSTFFVRGGATISCGAQPDGVGIVADQAVLLPGDLRGPARMQAGAPYTLSWLPSLGSTVWVWFADELQQPVPIGVGGWSFLAPQATVFLGVFSAPGPFGPYEITFTAPPTPAWIGKRLAFQAASLDGTVSRPVFSVVTY